VATRLDALRNAAQLLGEREENVPQRIEALLARLREAEKAAKAPRAATHRLDASAALKAAQQAGMTQVIVQSYPGADANALRALADDLRGATGRFVAILGAASDGRPALLVAASRDLVGEGFDSGTIVREAARHIGGGGGGRPDLAQAGGKDAAGLDEALREAGRLALEALQRIESA
jgi:alanyl-tRNA synthetase